MGLHGPNASPWRAAARYGTFVPAGDRSRGHSLIGSGPSGTSMTTRPSSMTTG